MIKEKRGALGAERNFQYRWTDIQLYKVYDTHTHAHTHVYTHRNKKKRDVSSIHLMAVWSLYSQHASAAWEPEGSHSAAENLGLILCIIKHSAASQHCSYTSSTLNKHNDDIRCNSR